ncbi:hypothetical protein HKBW3S43_00418, partial [Candidatus Hakubella thermalkaliphila]
MAQHFLDRAKVSPIFQKMSGKVMKQRLYELLWEVETDV